MIWGAELESELSALGREHDYACGACLAHCVSRPPMVRYVISGLVDTYVHIPGGTVHVSRAGPGELLGLHAHLYADKAPHLCWKAVSDVVCREIAWPDIEALMNTSPRVDGILQRIAQIQHYTVTLAAHPVFGCLDVHTRAELFDHSTLRMLSPGEQLIRRKGARAHLYLLVNGKVLIRTATTSHTLSDAGELLGEMSLFGYSEGPTADVVAQSACEIIEFNDSDMHRAMRDHPRFGEQITSLVGTRIANHPESEPL